MSSSLYLLDVFADRLHAALAHEPVETAAEIGSHPAARGFHPTTIAAIVDRLVADGRLSDDEHGRLVIAPLVDDVPRAA